jgi:putative peptide zinc metalloprotease protein
MADVMDPSALDMPVQGINRENRALLERLHREMPGAFDVSQAAAALGLDDARTRKLLAYLAHERPDLIFLVEKKLRPLGLLVNQDGTEPEVERSNPLLGLRFKYVVTDPEVTRRSIDLVLHKPADPELLLRLLESAPA